MSIAITAVSEYQVPEVIKRHSVELEFTSNTLFPSDNYVSSREPFKATKAFVIVNEHKGQFESIFIQVVNMWTQQSYTFDHTDEGIWYNTDVAVLRVAAEDFVKHGVR